MLSYMSNQRAHRQIYGRFIFHKETEHTRGNITMAKRTKSQRFSSLINIAGFVVDGYNGYKYHAKNKKLVYISLGLSTVGTLLDFYISIKSPRKFKKAIAIVTLITNGARLFTSLRKVKHEY